MKSANIQALRSQPSTCICVLRALFLSALLPHVLCVLRALVSRVFRALRTLVPHLPWVLHALMPHVPRDWRVLYSTCSRISRAFYSRASCLTSFMCQDYHFCPCFPIIHTSFFYLFLLRDFLDYLLQLK